MFSVRFCVNMRRGYVDFALIIIDLRRFASICVVLRRFTSQRKDNSECKKTSGPMDVGFGGEQAGADRTWMHGGQQMQKRVN